MSSEIDIVGIVVGVVVGVVAVVVLIVVIVLVWCCCRSSELAHF